MSIYLATRDTIVTRFEKRSGTLSGTRTEISPFHASGFQIKENDFTIYVRSVEDRLNRLDIFLAICGRQNWKVSAKNCTFYQTKVKWCRLTFDAQGYQMGPRNIEFIRNMNFPVTADELCQFLQYCRQISSCIPDLQCMSQPLSGISEAAYAHAGKRCKKMLKRVELHKLFWGAIHEAAFIDLKEALKCCSIDTLEREACHFGVYRRIR